MKLSLNVNRTMSDFTDLINPCDDFDNHVNAVWKEQNPTPDDYSLWNNFSILVEKNINRLKGILESSNSKNLAILYSQGNDVANRQNIKSVMEKISVLTMEFKLHFLLKYRLSTSISMISRPDKKNSERNVLHMGPGSLGLPDRDYYFSENMEDKRDEYIKFMTTIFNYLDMDASLITDLYNFEKKLAEARFTKTELRDPFITYNPITFTELDKKYSFTDFNKIFDTLNISKNETIILTQPKYFDKLQQLVQTEPKIYNLYLKWHTILDTLNYCDDTAYNFYHNFYKKILTGQTEIKPRWKRVINIVDENLGELLGRDYVTKYFDAKAKNIALDMVKIIILVLRKRIEDLDWMQAETKKMAYEKLDKLTVKIGYPDKWKDYSKLNLSNDKTYFENILECWRWDTETNLAKCYQPSDPTEWHMSPQTVNAYYNPTMNEIVFPAGILQEPFFDINYGPGENFGSFGAIIGHEITHGFDDKGKLYDAFGNLKTWWTEQDTEIYNSRTMILREQFDKYIVEGVKVNGSLTLGENIADLGGLTISYYSMLEYVKNNSDEFISVQKKLFFYQWAKSWRCNYRIPELKKRVLTDFHSPAFLRINGIVKNMPEFCECFGMFPSNRLYLADKDRAKIW